MIVAVAGDVGGARALAPVLAELRKRGDRPAVVENGYLATGWDGAMTSVAEAERLIERGAVRALIFATSVHDTAPLALARRARGNGIPVLCLLDNWMNYRMRLEIDGQPPLIPDHYLVMDDLARREAEADGIPAEALTVVGQPALGGLADAWRAWRPDPATKPSLLFISEPVALDQGSDASHANYRGYTQFTVLGMVIDALERVGGRTLTIVPHPREEVAALVAFVAGKKPTLACVVDASGASGREAVFSAEGVIGMASILLYEAWLLGKPTASLQPALPERRHHFLADRPGLFCAFDEETWHKGFDAWLATVGVADTGVRPDLAAHEGAAAAVADLLETYQRNRVNQPL